MARMQSAPADPAYMYSVSVGVEHEGANYQLRSRDESQGNPARAAVQGIPPQTAQNKTATRIAACLRLRNFANTRNDPHLIATTTRARAAHT